MTQLKGMKIAILVANGFEQVELEKPKQFLEEQGATTVIVSPEEDKVQGWNHTDKGDFFAVDMSLSKANASDYDALLLPGGVMNPDRLRTIPEAIAFVKNFNQQSKPIAAICHGPWILINAGIAKGHQVTSWASIKEDLVNAGAQWKDVPVVIDKQLITSRKPDDIPQFNEAMLKVFTAHVTA